jgi:hypothetical protein
MVARDWAREGAMLCVRIAVGLYFLNLGYGFEGTGMRLRDYRFVSDLFGGQKDPIGDRLISGNRFTSTVIGEVPVPLPKNYLLGLDIQQQDFEDCGRSSYLGGNWRDRGWWYYYIYAAAIKVPLGLWCLGALGLLGAFLRKASVRGHGTDCLLLLIFPLTILCAISAQTEFSEHFRYALPCFPFLFIWLAGISVKWTRESLGSTTGTEEARGIFSKGGARLDLIKLIGFGIPFLIIWTILSSLWIYPHSLSYFNESIGGPLNGSNHLLGSNVDWGQGLKYLEYHCNSETNERIEGVLTIGGYSVDSLGVKLRASVSQTETGNDKKRYLAVGLSRLLAERNVRSANGIEDSAIRDVSKCIDYSMRVWCFDGHVASQDGDCSK